MYIFSMIIQIVFTYTYSSGNIYEGQWKDNKQHGVGTMHWFARGEVYSGEWVNGHQHGNGTHLWTFKSSDSSQVIIFYLPMILYACVTDQILNSSCHCVLVCFCLFLSKRLKLILLAKLPPKLVHDTSF